ncbi:Intracellular ribonuclease LX [Bienertia sinuspersici]
MNTVNVVMLINIILFITCLETSSTTNQTVYQTTNFNASLLPKTPLWNHLLVVDYGVNYCVINQCYGNPIHFQVFTIHGLWPQGPQPYLGYLGSPLQSPSRLNQNCHPDTFLESDVAPLLNLLYVAWPSLTNYQVPGQPQGFWRYEWLKHGTCSYFDKYTYFQRALALFWLVNPDFLLRILPPSTSITYTADDILDAHKLLLLPKPYVSCGTAPSGEELLYELYYCFDNNGYLPIDCSQYYQYQTNCKGRFKILPVIP